MNYRHAFHAGNHADVFKHAALVTVLEHLLAKPAPFAVLDTHAGVGVYGLDSDEALRTREFEAGVGRLAGADLPAARGYLALLADLNPHGLAVYPGSPEIVRRHLREQDRLIACELHPADHAALKGRYRGDRRIAAHRRDGYEAVGALTPPAERRGLVLIDPPYEAPDEAERVVAALTAGLRRWRTGVFMAWYPIKDGAIGDMLAGAASVGAFPRTLRAELTPLPRNGTGMAGGGLIVVNAPWRLDEKLASLAERLAALLGDGMGTWSVGWVTPP